VVLVDVMDADEEAVLDDVVVFEELCIFEYLFEYSV
jgi:hypothetical protein